MADREIYLTAKERPRIIEYTADHMQTHEIEMMSRHCGAPVLSQYGAGEVPGACAAMLGGKQSYLHRQCSGRVPASQWHRCGSRRTGGYCRYTTARVCDAVGSVSGRRHGALTLKVNASVVSRYR